MSVRSWWCGCLLALGCSTPDPAAQPGARRLDAIMAEPLESPRAQGRRLERDPYALSWASAEAGALWLWPPGGFCFDGELASVMMLVDGVAAEQLRKDGWGRPMRVRCGEAGPYVYSAGPDGESGTDDDVGYRLHWLALDPRKERDARADEPALFVHGARGEHRFITHQGLD